MTTNELLAEIRGLTVELDPDGAMDENHNRYLQLVIDVLKQIRADGAPMFPVVEFVRENVHPEDM